MKSVGCHCVLNALTINLKGRWSVMLELISECHASHMGNSMLGVQCQGTSGTRCICNVQVLTELQWVYWRDTQGDRSLLKACVENEKKVIFSFYPGLAIYNGWAMWRKEVHKKKDSYPLLSMRGRSDKCIE